MNKTKTLDSWNEILTKANLKAKRVVDHQTAEVYFEVAKYNDNNSLVCNIVKNIFKKTGVDMRFSFLNISSVIFTTKNFSELEDFINSMTFDLVDENFIYQQTSVAQYKDNSFRRGAINDLTAHGISFAVVGKDELNDEVIVGPGKHVIRSDQKGDVLLDLAKKTAAHIQTIQKN